MRILLLEESWWLAYLVGAFSFLTLGLLDSLLFERYFPIISFICVMFHALISHGIGLIHGV